MLKQVHFVGLGGIGMSALARILLQRGSGVQGSDISQSALLTALQEEGAKVHIGHSKEAVYGATAVVYSTDVKSDNVELVAAKEAGVPLFHRSEMLDLLIRGRLPLLVTGTHGKTTTTALLASTLEEAGLQPSFVIGGIHRRWNTNSFSGAGKYFVAEADESDGSFLKPSAYGAIVTNLENDHLDYWKTAAKLDSAFGQFVEQVQEHLVWCGDDLRLQTQIKKGTSYGFQEGNAFRILSWKPTDAGLLFSCSWNNQIYKEIFLSLFGRHNALNGAAVFCLALQLGVDEAAIRKAFATFAGTARRFEFKGSAQAIDIYDDYGHHPTEIATTISALRSRVRERRLIVVFQPHRYTRVRDLFDEFSSCFQDADLVVMTDIYAAGEAPIEGITSEALYAKLLEKMGAKLLFIPRSDLVEKVAEQLRPHDVVLTLGAGDVTKIGEPILQLVRKTLPKLKVAVLFGGTSPEHEVSLMSSQTIIDGLDPTLYDLSLFCMTKEGQWRNQFAVKKMGEVVEELSACDVAIPVFHGPRGEDGMIQGFLETLNVAYVGADYRSSALCMQKAWTKHIAVLAGVPTAPYFEMRMGEYTPEKLTEQIEAQFSYPVWLKAVHLGSSIGVIRVEKKEDVAAAAATIFGFDTAMIVEKEMLGREIEYSLLGNEYIQVALPGEIAKEGIFHAYDKKYGAGASETLVPAPISESQRKIGESLAIEMYRKTGCKGLARIDFFLDKEGHFWLNEINPFPGFTKTSATPIMWAASGMPIEKVCSELVILGLHAHRT